MIIIAPTQILRRRITSLFAFERKILCLLLVVVANLQPGYSQPRGYERIIDSLNQVINSRGRDTTQVNLLISLANYYMSSDPRKGKQTATEALTLAKELNYYDGQIRSLHALSFGNTITGEWAKGLDFAFQGIQLAKEHEPEMELSYSSIIGLAYQKQKDYKKILDWTLKPLRRLSITSRDAEDWKHQLKQTDEVRRFETWSCAMLSSLGFMETGSIDSAFYYANVSLEAAKTLPLHVSGYSYGTLANVYEKDEQFDSSRVYFQHAKRIMEDTGERFAVQEFNRDLAKLYSILDKKDSVYKYASLAYEEARKINNPLVVQDASAFLADYYEPIDKAKALHYLRICNGIKDSISTMEQANQVYQLEWEQGRKAAEIEKARIANESKIRQNALLGSLTTVVLIAAIIFYNNVRKQKANRMLAAQKSQLESTLENLKAAQSQLIQSEKMASLGELTAGIAHEIQNPLNFVNNFSEVSNELIEEMVQEANKGNIDDAKRIAEDVKKNLEKINQHGKRADGIVKSMLQHSQTSGGQKTLTDINQLCEEYLRLSYHGLRAKDKSFNTTIETHFEPGLNVSVVPQEIGRVILNLVSNAFYAVNEKKNQNLPGYEPLVSISTKRIKDKLEISVADNGTGISSKVLAKVFQPFFTTKPTGKGTGLGLSLSYDIVKAHQGEIKIETKDGEGTRFVVLLPFS